MEIFRTQFDFWPFVLKYAVFLAPLVQVSLMTMRTIFVTRGMRRLATVSAFFEMSIWLFAMKELLVSMNDITSRTIYAAFFACGVFIGSKIEEKLSLGVVIVRMIVQQNAAQLIKNIADAGFGVTQTQADGAFGPGILLLSVVQRKREDELKEIIERFNPTIFHWTEDVRSINSSLPLFWRENGRRTLRSIAPGLS
jgi:uncharacterized protein YebE (UPF0316 family)